MLRILIGAAAIVVVYAGTAQAQPGDSGNSTGNSLNMNMLPDGRRRQSPEDAYREQQIEREYRETVNSRIPDKKPATSDPWGNVRAAPGGSSAAKQQR
jgi:hypothetical protein